ncbi:hypothetical protein JCM9279_004101 [Rhodotorula babjevae]
MDENKSSARLRAPQSFAATTLLDLPDELLLRIFDLVQDNEPALFGQTVDHYDLSRPFPVLASYRGISRRLHHRGLVPQARRTVVIPSHVAVPAGAAWEADADPRISNVLREGQAVVASLVLDIPLGRLPPWSATLFESLVNLGELTISGGIVLTPSLGLALRQLKSLRKMALHIVPDDDHKLIEQAWTISLGRDVPSLTHLDISFVTVPTARHTLGIFSMDDAHQLRFLAIDAVVGPSVNWHFLEVLVLRAASTSTHGAGEALAEFLKDISEVPKYRQSSPFVLKELVIDVAYAEFDLYAGWNSIDRLLDRIKYAPSATALEIRFSALFRCDAGKPDTEAPTIVRLAVVETTTPSDDRQSANINGLEDFLDVFPNLDAFSLVSHWFLPSTDAADLRADPDPPTDLSLAYDAPLLAQLVMYVRDETAIKDFRYRRSEREEWELRWTREGDRGTQFRLSRWWL